MPADDGAALRPAFRSYAEFWPHYLAAHGRAGTRALHYAGTAAGAAIFAFGLATGRWLLLPLALAVGYAFAWLAHWRFEGNRPATFGHPLWSFYSDFRMLALWAAGRLGAELDRHGITPRGGRAP